MIAQFLDVDIKVFQHHLLKNLFFPELSFYLSYLYFIIIILFYFCFLGPHLQHAADGSSQTRGPMGATAAGLHHSHSNRGSKPHLRQTTAHGNARPLTPWTRPGIEPATSWFLVGLVSVAPRWELHLFTFLESKPFVYVWVYFQIFSPVSFICLSLFVPVPHCLDYHKS